VARRCPDVQAGVVPAERGHHLLQQRCRLHRFRSHVFADESAAHPVCGEEEVRGDRKCNVPNR